MKRKTRLFFGVLFGGLVIGTAALLVALLTAEGRAGERDLFGGLAKWALILLGIAFSLPCFLADFLAVKGACLLTEGDYETETERIADIVSLSVSTVQILAFAAACLLRLCVPEAVTLTAFKIFTAVLWAGAGVTVTIEIERMDN